MKATRLFVLVLILVLLPFAIKVFGGDFGQANSLFTDIKANHVGDILTVMIYENSRASTSSESKTEKSTQSSVSGGPGIGSLSFIPLFGAEGQNSNTFDGKGENSRNGSLRAQMSVTVVEIRNNGDLVIEGTRTVGVSGDKETLRLTGVVRQKDISPNNTIESYLIADAEIHYSGKGAGNTASRPGIVTKIINWIF